LVLRHSEWRLAIAFTAVSPPTKRLIRVIAGDASP
jgi:hypothetical protein